MPFNSDTNLFERIWAFVDQFSTDEAVNRSDIDAAFNDVRDGLNDTNTYLKALIDAAAASPLYLGRRSSAPTTNNQGGDLVEGNTYVKSPENTLFVWNAVTWVLVGDLPAASAYFKTLVQAADASTLRGLLELGTAATLNSTALLRASNDLSDLADADTGLANMGLSADTIAFVKAANFVAARIALGVDASSNADWSIDPEKRATRGDIAAFVAQDQTRTLIVQDQKAAGTDGGTFTNGAWRTRDLNFVLFNDISGATVSANRINLPVGTYDIEASAPAYQTQIHKARIYDFTNAAELLFGTSEYNFQTSAYAQTRSHVSGRITLASPASIELQHRCAATRNGNGFGNACNFDTEVYSTVKIRRVG